MKSTLSRLIATTLSLAFIHGALADVSGIAETCEDCHGKNGISQHSDIPTIAGISSFVGSDALLQYRDEARPCEQTEYRHGDTGRAPTDMCAITKDLSDEQIEQLAEYFASKPFVAAKQEFDAAKAARGKTIHDEHCERCHTDNGSNPKEDAGILAGQWIEYLRDQFAEYAAGERSQPEKMQEKLDPLSAEDTEALIHFYASQQ